MDVACPLAIVREFLAGLFGGDGHTPKLAHSSTRLSSSITPVKFSQSIVEKHLSSLEMYMQNIRQLLERCGVAKCTQSKPEPHTYTNGRMIPQDYEENPRFKITVRLPMSTSFAEKIGFRYAVNKNLCLSVATAYWRLGENIKHGRNFVTTRTAEIYKTYIPEYRCAYCNALFSSRNCVRRHQLHRCKISTGDLPLPTTHCTVQMALDQAREEFLSSNVLLHHKQLSSCQEVSHISLKGLPRTTRRIRNTISPEEFFEITGTTRWFAKSEYPVSQDSLSIPNFYLHIAGIRKNGTLPVYDIEVENNHSFLANGLCVHNCQQRARRFRAALDRDQGDFDNSALTPGTKFMDHLTKYVDWYLRNKVSDAWAGLEVIFSNEKVPGEGEHTCLDHIRTCPDTESFLIHGADADLIMLGMASQKPQFYILREDLYSRDNDYHLVDTGGLAQDLAQRVKWDSTKKFRSDTAITDLVFLFFTVGNDFLPHIPNLEILEGGIDHLVDVFRTIGESYGHLTHITKSRVAFFKKPLEVMFGTLARNEKEFLEEKLNNRERYCASDPLLENCARLNSDGKFEVDFTKYREVYYTKKVGLQSPSQIADMCYAYLTGMDWVIKYYTTGVPSWTWSYPYSYAPFCSDLARYIRTFHFPEFELGTPNLPFQQLLCVLPPASAHLLPGPLGKLLTDEGSAIRDLYPESFVIDASLRLRDWEATVVLPPIDTHRIYEAYDRMIGAVSDADRRRNVHGRNFRYFYTEEPRLFKSFYGNIDDCHARSEPIDSF